MRAMMLMQAGAGGGVGLLLVVAAGPAFRIGIPLLGAFGLLALGALVGFVTGVAGIFAVIAALRGAQSLPPVVLGGIACGLVAAGLPAQRLWSARQAPAM